VKGVLELHSPDGSRLDLAVHQLKTGSGFTYRDIWFRIEEGNLHCEAVTVGEHLREPRDLTAMALIDHSLDTLGELRRVSPAFVEATAGLDTVQAIISDYGTGSVVLCVLVDGSLVWQ
jgi:hypothetical protein